MRERIYYRPPKHTPLPAFFGEHRLRGHIFRLGAAGNDEQKKSIMSAHNGREAEVIRLQRERNEALLMYQNAGNPLDEAKAKVAYDRKEAELMNAVEDVRLDHEGFLSDDYLPKV